MVTCCICKQENSPLFPRKFHSFPSNSDRREQWFKSIGRVINTYRTARVCSEHFTQNDYYVTGTPVQPVRLKSSAVPSVFLKKKSKEDSIIDIQDTNQHDSTLESQFDKQPDSAIDDIQCDSTIKLQHDGSIIEIPYDSIIIVQCDDESGSTVNILPCDNEQDSTIEVQQYSEIEIKQDSPIEIQDENEHVSVINTQYDIENDSIIDDQDNSEHDSIFDVQQDSDVDAKPPLVTKNDKTRKRKRSDVSNLEKVFLKTGKYQTECLKKTDFTNIQAWLTLLKFLHYTRRLRRRTQTQNVRLQHKIISMQTVAEKLKTHYIETMHRANEEAHSRTNCK